MTPEATKSASAKSESKKPVAKKGPSKDINKSAEIRKIAAAMKAKNEKPRPVVIMDMLKKQGIDVSSPQVSMVLKKMGFRPRRRRANSEAADRPATGMNKKATKVTVEDLVKAKRIATQMGGIERALAALQALKGFE